MEPCVLHIHGDWGSGNSITALDTSVLVSAMGGVGKIALASLIANAMDARQRVFISFNYDDLLDEKQRLLELLNELDQDVNAGQDRNASERGSLILLGDLHQLVPGFLCDVDPPDRLVAFSRAQLRSIVRSAVREIDRAIDVFLSIAEKPDRPVTDFLIERRWFLLHGVHPPRRFQQTVPICPSGVCSRLVSGN